MRLPTDAALIVVEGPSEAQAQIAELRAAWREERLPVFLVSGRTASREAAPGETLVEAAGDDAFARGELERLLESLDATTLVFCGSVAAATVETAVGLGYRVFVVAEAGERPFACDARVVDARAALLAARSARARERLKASRR